MESEPGPENELPERERMDLAEISNAMVRLYKDLFGRGPTRARSVLAGPDTLVCTLENSMTRPEQNLVEAGQDQRVRDVRMYFQQASEKDFLETVERITGRKVRGFVSGIDTHQDIATEVFYLEPPGVASGRAGRSDELAPD